MLINEGFCLLRRLASLTFPLVWKGVNDEMTLGEILREARLKHNYTLKKLQEISGLKYWHISKLELGKHKPKPETLKILAASLSLDLDLLLTKAGHTSRGMKICKKCNKVKPATIEFFKLKNDKLNARCRNCVKEDKAISYIKNLSSRKIYLKKNEHRIKNYKKHYREVNKESIKQYNKEYLPEYYQENIEVLKKNMSIYYVNHRDEFSKRRKIRYKLNKKSEKEYMKKYRTETKYNIRYYRENRDYCLSIRKEWFRNNPHKTAYYRHKRRSLLRNLEASLTIEQWKLCLEYFDNRDAYTGLPMKVLTQDHIIPVSRGGGYTVNNIIPCDKHINSSKNNKEMEDWYREQLFFSEERLNKIYTYIDEVRIRFASTLKLNM